MAFGEKRAYVVKLTRAETTFSPRFQNYFYNSTKYCREYVSLTAEKVGGRLMLQYYIIIVNLHERVR